MITQSKPANDVDKNLRLGFRVVCSTALYPLEYSKTLIQLGYEPIAPRPGRTLFGARRMMLPNIFQYAAYIKSVDGFTGCFRGLSARLVGNLLSAHFSEKVTVALLGKKKARITQSVRETLPDFKFFGLDEFEEIEDTSPDTKEDMVYKAVTHFCGVIISHPFHVISIRMMAQFIGREHMYDGLFGSIKEIWVHEGISGFFSGLIPRLWMDFCCIAVTSAITYFLSKTVRGLVDPIAHFTVTSVMYPYHVVSTCMAVQGSRLRAGNPPLMDHFINWRYCYASLLLNGEHKRGSSFFFRSVARAQIKPNNAFAPYPDLK